MQDDGFSGNVKLDVIGVAVEVETMSKYVVTKGEQVEGAQERTKHRALREVQLLMLMNCLSVGSDLSHKRAVLVMLREDSRQDKRTVWLMMW